MRTEACIHNGMKEEGDVRIFSGASCKYLRVDIIRRRVQKSFLKGGSMGY